MPLTSDYTADGIAIFDGETKVAVLHQKTDNQKTEKGTQRLDALPREGWTIHVTNPAMKVELFEAIAAMLPKEFAERPAG